MAKKNMGTIDKTVRTLLAIFFLVLIFTGTVSGGWAIVLGLLAVVFLVTSFISFCPLYYPFKFSTRKKGAEGEAE